MKEGRGGTGREGGGGGTIRSGRPLLLSICPHSRRFYALVCHTMHPRGTLYCSHSVARSRVMVYVNVFLLCIYAFSHECAHIHSTPPPPSLYICPYTYTCMRVYIFIYICINTVHLFPWVESMDLLSHLPLTTPLRHEQRNTTHANTTAVIIYRIRIRMCTRVYYVFYVKCFLRHTR